MAAPPSRVNAAGLPQPSFSRTRTVARQNPEAAKLIAEVFGGSIFPLNLAIADTNRDNRIDIIVLQGSSTTSPTSMQVLFGNAGGK